MVMLAVVLALCSAAGFALSTSLQHRAAHSHSGRTMSLRRLVHALAGDRMWLLGITVGAASFGLHALAVTQGALAVVQPIIVSGVVMAVPVRAALERQHPSARDVRWAAVTAGGLVLLIVTVDPTSGNGQIAMDTGLGLAAAAVVVASVPALLAGRSHRPQTRGFLLGATAGVLFGLLAGLLKLTMHVLAHDGIAATFLSWPAWTMVAVGLSGMALNQRAYQAAPLAVSMPVLNVVAVLGAIGFGAAVFAEIPAHTGVDVLVEMTGLVIIAVGLRRLFQGPVDETPASSVPSGRTGPAMTCGAR